MCMCIYIYIYIYMYMYICVYMYLCIDIHVYMCNICVCEYMKPKSPNRRRERVHGGRGRQLPGGQPGCKQTRPVGLFLLRRDPQVLPSNLPRIPEIFHESPEATLVDKMSVYRGTSLIRKRTPQGPYHRPMPRVLRGS
jgi:hypothetical protein